jgi:alanyl-tRNA synthetase
MTRPRTVDAIREAFLGFFEAKEHLRMASDSLVPSNDPTLLFTGAGMNQFKDEFLGRGRDLKRATTAQKCLRVPDLENVGLTPRHHTFFEMLGNFSFGDYFKAETIPWEWTFFTEVLGWEADRFVATVYQDDDEAFAIWRDVIGLPEERIYRFGEKENFWPAEAPSKGPNGPCGPCSELYWDQQPGEAMPAREGLEDLPGRFLEVGNFVFTQFNRQDGGALPPLPQKNIDVGLGLERIAAVAQDVPNNFGTDLWVPVLDAIQSAADLRYGEDSATDVRMRRIADHARAVFFCIADGAMPGREGRGYVVRKILRRAVRDGLELGIDRPFLAGLLPTLQQSMGEAYPELHEQATTIEALAHGEEERFREVYDKGITRLEVEIGTLKRQRGTSVFPGEIAFELHDTYGFPVDITEVVAREAGLALDEEGFVAAMEAQRERARAGSGMKGDVFAESLSSRLQAAGAQATEFLGFREDEAEAHVIALLDATGALIEQADAGASVRVVLDRTPFYAEGGGQVGDCGALLRDGAAIADVTDTHAEDGFTLHTATLRSPLAVGDAVKAAIDARARRATEAHHTGTHLLHAAMKEVLGAHVSQAGSKVAPDGLRFDYTQPDPPSREQLDAIEDLVNREVLRASAVDKRMSTLRAAKEAGVTALFGEKYGDEVRVVEVPGFSAELCGGCHVPNTGAIGPLRIVSDRALSAGVRRIEAVTGLAALAVARGERDRLGTLEAELKTPADRLLERVQGLKEQLKEAKQRKVAAVPEASAVAEELAGQDGPLAWKHLPGLDAGTLRALSDDLRNRELPPLVLLTGGDDADVPFLFLCAKDSGRKAGDLAKALGSRIGGGGGGRPDFAQGKGSQGGALEAAVAALQQELAAPA